MDDARVGQLGSLLRAYRRRAGLSQRALADLSAVSVRAIRDLESGRRRHPRPETVRLLADGLGIGDPQRAALEVAVPGAARGEDPEPATEDRLPVPGDALIGRHNELRALRELVTASGQRLVAVVGVAGIGKTRLVLDLARSLRVEGACAVRWVPREPGTVPQPRTIAEHTLELLRARMTEMLRGDAVDVHAVARLIGGSEVLVVLDGHTAVGTANDELPALLALCPGLRIVMTTRDPRLVPEWTVVPVAPLPVPAEGLVGAEEVDSVRLLLRHVHRYRPDFRLGPANAGAVADVCRLVDGVPALLELAARWSVVYTLDDLRESLSRDPLELLSWPESSGRPRGTADSIRASLQWLDAPVRELLAALVRIDGDWPVSRACEIVGRPVPDVAGDVHVLLLNGLVRRIERADGVYFRTLRLARYFVNVLGGVPCTSAGRPGS